MEEGDHDITLRTGLVLWKSLISIGLAALSLWVILSSPGVFSDFECSAATDTLNLCAFQIAAFCFSVLLNIPLLIESFNMNKVFFVWLLQGDFLTEKARVTAQSYIKFVGSLGLMNYDEEEFNLHGKAIVERVVHNITRPRSQCSKLLSFVRSFISVVLLIPLLFVLRVIIRLGQTVVTLPWIITDREYRLEMARVWRGLLMLPSLMLADPLCVILLFPLSFVIIFGSNSVQEVFLNLVAVQVFAQIDDEFVSNAFHPQFQLLQRANIYYESANSGTVAQMESEV